MLRFNTVICILFVTILSNYVIVPVHATLLSFTINPVSQDFLTTADWVFESDIVLPITLDECWDIITDDEAWQYWHPEVANIQNVVGIKGTVGSARTISFQDWLTNILLVAPNGIGFTEVFDLWDENSSSTFKRYSLYFERSSRPNAMTWRGGREDFICESISSSSSSSSMKNNTTTETRFIRTVALDPGLLTRLASFIIHPRLEEIFEVKCPARLLDSINSGVLPRVKEQK